VKKVSDEIMLQGDHGTRIEPAFYRNYLLEDILPFWMQHGWDRERGGMWTALDRDGTLLDSDKYVWFQGRSCWMFATMHNTWVARGERPDPRWLTIAQSCASFLDRCAGSLDRNATSHARGAEEENGIGLSHLVQQHPGARIPKLYFTVTRDAQPLRMRRYYYSESFAAIAYASMAKATGESRYRAASVAMLEVFLQACLGSERHRWAMGKFSELEVEGVPSKTDPKTRPMQGIGPWMIAMASAQELRANLGDVEVLGDSCTTWIDRCIATIDQVFYKRDLGVLMEVVGAEGEVLDHFDTRQLNPGHAIECAWFILHESLLRSSEPLQELGLGILDCMWQRGWDQEYGGLFYFRDVYDKPVQEYWHDMKFWWPHCEAIIATALAFRLTNQERYRQMHEQVHAWSFKHFADPEHGEWFGYLHRDGGRANTLKGSMWKGPFHLPRMLWYCSQLGS
jgi:N-acylglucosamine 2-epimerase